MVVVSYVAQLSYYLRGKKIPFTELGKGPLYMVSCGEDASGNESFVERNRLRVVVKL